MRKVRAVKNALAPLKGRLRRKSVPKKQRGSKYA